MLYSHKDKNSASIQELIYNEIILKHSYCLIPKIELSSLLSLIKDTSLFNRIQLHNCTVPIDSVSEKNFDTITNDIDKQQNRRFKMINATSEEFPLHTDCVYNAQPIDCLVLYCESNAELGGENLLLPCRDFIKNLTKHEVEYFKQPIFPFRHNFDSIINETSSGVHWIRYNRHGINNAAAILNYTMPNRMTLMLNRVDEMLSKSRNTIEIKLKPHEALFVNNKYFFHGRKSFNSETKRVFKRMRLFFSDSYNH